MSRWKAKKNNKRKKEKEKERKKGRKEEEEEEEENRTRRDFYDLVSELSPTIDQCCSFVIQEISSVAKIKKKILVGKEHGSDREIDHLWTQSRVLLGR